MKTDHGTRRLDLADTRSFAQEGAGQARRLRLASHAHTALADLWDEAVAPHGNRAREGIALAAVGSLGRGDAGPLSDYDLILVHDGRTVGAGDVAEIANSIWYPLWDNGIRLDHSVRTLGECRTVASGDLSAALGMLDIDWVAGDPVLVAGVRQGIAHDWRANARKRLPELVESMRARHERHGDLTSSLEPDIKEGRGGLRDMTVLRALAGAWLADRPHGDVDDAYARLLDVRDALHVATGRGRETLHLDDQDAVAALLGHPDSDYLLTGVVDAGRRISHALEATLRRAGQSQRARVLRVGPRRPILTPLGYGLYEHDGEVVLGPNHADGHPDHLLLVRAARAAARSRIPLSPTTIANLSRGLEPLPDPWPEDVRDAFLDLLATGPGLVPVWEALDLAGIVELWIPEWKAVRSRPQRNSVHRYTVDRHLVETVVQAYERRADVSRPDVLLVTALLHDIGKISGVHDHAEEGAPVAASIARRMGLGEREAADVELLVRRHLTLIEYATRRDPQDAATVAALAEAVDHRLDLFEQLRALTEADALAAGPKAWTGWRSGLVDQLTAQVRASLTARPAPSFDDDPASEVLADALPALRMGEPFVRVTRTAGGAEVLIADRDRLGLFADSAGLLAATGVLVRAARVRTIDDVAVNTWQIESPFSELPAEEDLVRGLAQLGRGDHGPLRALERRRPTPPPLGSPPPRATLVPGGSQTATVIEVRCPDRPGLLREIGMAFTKAGMAVRSAHVATYAGQTLDTFYITAADGRVLDPPAAAGLIGTVIDALDPSGTV